MAQVVLAASANQALHLPEKQQFADVFVEAVRDVMALHDKQLAAHAGASPGDRFTLAMQFARIKRDRAKKLYAIHARTHGS